MPRRRGRSLRGGRCTRSRARSAATSIRIASGTTSSTSPMRRASFAGMRLPVSIRSRAVCTPRSLGNRCVPPPPGKRPSSTSGRPSFVFGSRVATRSRQATATSRPPPRQAPWIAATTGLFASSRRFAVRCARRDMASASVAFRTACSMPMSAPTMKLSFLAEARTMAMTSSFPSRSSSTRSRSYPTEACRVLTFCPGTSIDTTATPSLRVSTRKDSRRASVIAPPRGPWPRPARRPRTPCTGRGARRAV